jgi:hypothetical protein
MMKNCSYLGIRCGDVNGDDDHEGGGRERQRELMMRKVRGDDNDDVMMKYRGTGICSKNDHRDCTRRKIERS